MRRAWVDIDVGALLRNGAAMAARARVPLLPMVKADAYGLGAVRVARTLERLETAPWGFGVATVREGEELREAGITRPILVFTPLLAGEFDALVRADLTPTLGDRDVVQRWAHTRRPWHLAVDTGMSRAGVQWNAVDALRDVLTLNPPQGVFTHFHSAELDDASRDEQERRFAAVLERLPIRPPMIHAENGAALEHRGPSPWTVCRPGIFLYGVSSGHVPALLPDPVVSLRARIVELRTIAAGESVSYDATWVASATSRIATLAIGYADGYRRAFGNRAAVLVRGRRAPVAGVVTMDMTMIDVTNVPCEIGDIATLIGADGDAQLTVGDVAAMGEVSPYELLTGLRARLPRRYVEESAP